ncbi:MAG: hypothetical protein ACLSH3_15910 [Alistipes finegoldii]
MKPERNNPTEVFENYRRQLRAFIARRVDSEAEGEDILRKFSCVSCRPTR